METNIMTPEWEYVLSNFPITVCPWERPIVRVPSEEDYDKLVARAEQKKIQASVFYYQ